MQRAFIFVLALILFQTCLEIEDAPVPVPEWAEVYRPIYGNPDEVYKIEIQASRSITKPSKIFIYQQYLMVNIRDEGIHVIDNTNPAAPRPLYFISIPGNQDVKIKDGILFVDNYSDLVAFRINADQEIEILERMKGKMNNRNYPPFRNVYFHCADPEQGEVIGWELTNAKEPKCYRP
jgi:hypothetical protein